MIKGTGSFRLPNHGDWQEECTTSFGNNTAGLLYSTQTPSSSQSRTRTLYQMTALLSQILLFWVRAQAFFPDFAVGEGGGKVLKVLHKAGKGGQMSEALSINMICKGDKKWPRMEQMSPLASPKRNPGAACRPRSASYCNLCWWIKGTTSSIAMHIGKRATTWGVITRCFSNHNIQKLKHPATVYGNYGTFL